MPYIHKSGKQFGLADISITNGVQCRDITQVQYDALSTAEKNNGTVYFITDGNPNSLYINDPSPIGAILAYGGVEAPEGWLLCDGSAVNRIIYKDLFAVIGTTYGEGDTVTTFNLPNLKGRVAIGADTGYALGAIGGEATHILDIAETPSHRHWISAGAYDDGNMSTTGVSNSQDNGLAADAGTYSASDTCKAYGRYDAWAGGSNGVDGKGATQGTTSAHNNMQPYVVTNYIIKAHDAYRAGGSGGGGSVPPTASEYKKLLWENSSRTSAFASQTITLNLIDYDEVEVWFIHNTNADGSNLRNLVTRTKVGENGTLTIARNDSFLAQNREYNTTINGITFSDCVLGSSSTVYNNHSVPIYIYGIKYERVAPPQIELPTYSTTEQVVGTWIDGKPIYRKIITISGLSTGLNTISAPINIDTIITLRGMEKETTGPQAPFPKAHYNAFTYQIGLYYSGGNFYIEVGSNLTSITSAFIVLEYTKTTD